MKQESKEVPIEKLNPEQLQYVGKQLEGEINALSQSYTQLKIAAQKFGENLEYVDDLSKCKNKEILVPLTSSVYLPGKCSDVKKVTVDIGATYFVEMSLEKAKDYFKRKIQMLSTNMDQIDKTLKTKSQYMNIVNHHLAAVQQK